MARRKNTEDYSVAELRRMLIEKQRAVRQSRIERFRRTGRAVLLAPDVEAQSLEDLRSGTVDETLDETPRGEWRQRSKRFFDGFLLFVEIAAVLALVFVLVNGLGLIRELNQEVSAVFEQPVVTPTPLIQVVVLPSGHTPPTDPGGARPNEAEIPEHLRPLVQSMADIPQPTPRPEQAHHVQVPAIGVDHPIVQGDGWEQLKKGVGQHIGTSNPGKPGNLVLSAHNDIFGEIFKDLDQLKPGDQVVIYSTQRSYTYIVTGSKVVEPTQVEVLAPTNNATITLISCYPYLVDTQRIVVQAVLQPG